MTTTFDYSRSRATADRLIKRFGQTGAIRRTTTGGDPWDTITTETDYDCTLVVLDYRQSNIDGTLIQQNDKHVLVSAVGLEIEPNTSDKLVLAGQPLQIIKASPLAPGGTTVLFDIQARL